MNHRRFWRAAAFLAAGLAALAVHAGEITLYQHDGFAGRRVTFRGTTADVRANGFNDTTSSIVVHSGRWHACMDVQFGGECIELSPGQYPALERRFNDRISSLREVDDHDARDEWDGGHPAPGWRRGRGDITFYEASGFRGEALRLVRSEDNFLEHGFNDRASSMVIERGVWELCEHVQYGGPCRSFGPGHYERLGRYFDNRISSARLVRHGGREDGRGGEWGQPGQGVQLFSSAQFSGRQMTIVGDIWNLYESGFNDRAQSMVVHHGQWELCQHARFEGQCMVVGPGAYANLGSLSAQLSSLRRVR